MIQKRKSRKKHNTALEDENRSMMSTYTMMIDTNVMWLLIVMASRGMKLWRMPSGFCW